MNLVAALDALLETESVSAAAERLHTSPAAMSRTLSRLRATLHDPILVRAGQRMVSTPRAKELRAEVRSVVQRCNALLVPGAGADPAAITRTFTVQCSDLLLTDIAAPLLASLGSEAPGVTLHFRPETVEDTTALREGTLDLEIGVLDHVDPEARTESLYTTHMLGAVRPGHRLAKRKVSVSQFAAANHVSVSRKGRRHGPIDAKLAEHGLYRRISAVVPTFTAAFFLASESDVVCLTSVESATRGCALLGLRTFSIGLDLPPLDIGMAWHPRNDADPIHSWLRDRIRSIIASLVKR